MSEYLHFAWDGGNYRGSISSATDISTNDSSLCQACHQTGLGCQCAFHIYQSLTDPPSDVPAAEHAAAAFGAYGVTDQQAGNGQMPAGLDAIMHWNLNTQMPGNGEQSSYPGNGSPGQAIQPHDTQVQETANGLNFHPGAISPRMGRLFDYSETVDILHREAEEVEQVGRYTAGLPTQQATTSNVDTITGVPYYNTQVYPVARSGSQQLLNTFQPVGSIPAPGPSCLPPPPPPPPTQAQMPQCCQTRVGNPAALRKHQRCHRRDISCRTHPTVVFYKRSDYERHLLSGQHASESYTCAARTRSGNPCSTVITGRPDNLKRHVQVSRDHQLDEQAAEEYVRPFKSAYKVRRAEIRAASARAWEAAPLAYQPDAE